MFQYKTRGNASPQGKQKVYFTCHPDDFDRYFEKISDQILEHENCAVWYWDSEESYQDIATELGGMKLFVIPVTTKLLTTPNRTLDVELPFALEKHIPVLPLMQGSVKSSACQIGVSPVKSMFSGIFTPTKTIPPLFFLLSARIFASKLLSRPG